MAEDPPFKSTIPSPPHKGRGAVNNRDSRHAATHRETVDDGWTPQERTPLRTTVTPEAAKSILSRNDSPDILSSNR